MQIGSLGWVLFYIPIVTMLIYNVLVQERTLFFTSQQRMCKAPVSVALLSSSSPMTWRDTTWYDSNLPVIALGLRTTKDGGQ